MEAAICILKLIRTDSSSGPPGHGQDASSTIFVAGMSSYTVSAGGDGASENLDSACRAARSLLADVMGLCREGPISISETWH